MTSAVATMDWRPRAACKGLDLALFFPPAGGRIGPARSVCRGCPVRVACLEEAMQREGSAAKESRGGVWGGLTGDERYMLYRCRAGTCKHIAGCPNVEVTS